VKQIRKILSNLNVLYPVNDYHLKPNSLDGCEYSRINRDSMPGPSNPYRDALTLNYLGSQINNLYLQILSSIFTCFINIRNSIYSPTASQIYSELSVDTPLYTCCPRLTCINISLDSCLLATDRFQLLVFISVDVRLQYFMQYNISVNIDFIQLPQCCL
jgi:hypothetical protein